MTEHGADATEKIIAEMERRAKYFERLYKRKGNGFNLGASSNLKAMVLWARKKMGASAVKL